MKKLIVIISIFLLGTNLVNSQTVFDTAYDKHELSVSLGGGLSTLLYSPFTGDSKLGFGGNFGVGYAYFLNPNWGVRTGLELGLYNSRFNADNIDYSYTAADFNNTSFLFESKVSGYEEKNRAMMLQIPVMAQYQTGVFYGAAGLKIGIPLGGKFDAKGNFVNSGLYDYENYPYVDDPALGFRTYNGYSTNGDFSFKAAFLAAAEAGVKMKVSGTMTLYIGAYVDYGLNNIHKKSNKHFVHYNSEFGTDKKHFDVNSVAHANFGNSAFLDVIHPLSAGIRLRLAFGRNRVEVLPPRQVDAPRPAVVEEPAPAPAPTPPAQPTPTPTPPAQPPAQQPTAQPQTNQMTQAQRDALQSAVSGYELNESIIDARQAAEFLEKVQLLRQYPETRIHIQGHTCDTGNDEVNQRVGMARAERARDYLIANGIAANRILSLTSILDRQPVVPNTSEANRKLNRRVQLVIEE